MFTVRTAKPGAGNKCYIRQATGGWNSCIQGSPTDSQCNVLANCVGYANGRFNEIYNELTGNRSNKYNTLNCNAENFIERAKNAGLQVGSTPKPGAIMCWQKGASLSGNDGAGHVAVVERVNSDGSVYTSESGYGSSAFWNQTRKNSNGRWGIGSGYSFRGFIYNPAVKDEPIPASDPFPGVSDEELARRVWTGEFGNGDTRRQRLGIRYDAVQALVNRGIGKPSNPTPQPAPSQPSGDDLLTLVKKTIRGDFGNGQARRNALGSRYDEVQRQVNLNLQHGLSRWDNIRLF